MQKNQQVKNLVEIAYQPPLKANAKVKAAIKPQKKDANWHQFSGVILQCPQQTNDLFYNKTSEK